MLLVKLPVKSRQLVAKFWVSKKLYTDFQMCVWVVVLVHLTLALFKDQVYFQFFVEKITDLHFSGVSYWKIIMFYRWYGISLIFHIFWSFVFLFSRLKEQSPPPIYMLADFRRELPSLSPARYSQGFFFSDIFYRYTCSILLVSLWKWILKIICFLGADIFLFAFLRGILNTQIYVFSLYPADLGQLSAHDH